MPLSEEELRLLEQMERALVAEDPKLASTLRGTTMRRNARRRLIAGLVVFVIGIGVLMTGAVTKTTVVGIIGFAVMLGSAYVVLTSWKDQGPATDEAGVAVPEHPEGFGFAVIDGGRAGQPSKKRPKRGRGRSQGSMMERFEERWRRRRDQQGGGY